jgi:hypothetical protein
MLILPGGSEYLLKREGTILFTKEGTRVPSLKYKGVACISMNKTRGRRKMYITMGKIDKLIEQLLSTFSTPYQAPSFV